MGGMVSYDLNEKSGKKEDLNYIDFDRKLTSKKFLTRKKSYK